MIAIFNAIISGLGSVLQTILMVLPPSPFVWFQGLDNKWLGYINYIFPVGGAIAHLEAFGLAVLVYYGIRVVLRWIKAVQ